MPVFKYKDHKTGEIKKVGAPSVDAYSKKETDAKIAQSEATTDGKLATKAPAYSYGTADLTPGVSPLETGKLYFVYE